MPKVHFIKCREHSYPGQAACSVRINMPNRLNTTNVEEVTCQSCLNTLAAYKSRGFTDPNYCYRCVEKTPTLF